MAATTAKVRPQTFFISLQIYTFEAEIFIFYSQINTKVEDTNVTLEDQQSINMFARKNGRLQEYKAEIEEKKVFPMFSCFV